MPFLLRIVLTAWLGSSLTAAPTEEGRHAPSLSDAEFQALIQELSESPGYFPTDNLITNETSLLHVVPYLDAIQRPGLAYIGVGPDQNFSYIARLRPEIAFIIDIRRGNLLLHLYFKALFEESENRWQFLSRLLGRPIPEGFRPVQDADAAALAEFFHRIPSSPEYFEDRFEQVWRSMSARFPDLLSADAHHRLSIHRIGQEYFVEGLRIRYRMPRRQTMAVFPTLEELMTEHDGSGRPAHFLNSEEDFQRLRNLQKRNRIVPVVGDFAGSSAVRAVGEYLGRTGCPVGAFYFSNVEFYLFRHGTFQRFMHNLDAIPFADDAIVIRSFFNFWYGYGRHPDAREGYYVTSLGQRATSFLRHHAAAPYQDYWDLVTREYLRPAAIAEDFAPAY